MSFHDLGRLPVLRGISSGNGIRSAFSQVHFNCIVIPNFVEGPQGFED